MFFFPSKIWMFPWIFPWTFQLLCLSCGPKDGDSWPRSRSQLKVKVVCVSDDVATSKRPGLLDRKWVKARKMVHKVRDKI